MQADVRRQHAGHALPLQLPPELLKAGRKSVNAFAAGAPPSLSHRRVAGRLRQLGLAPDVAVGGQDGLPALDIVLERPGKRPLGIQVCRRPWTPCMRIHTHSMSSASLPPARVWWRLWRRLSFALHRACWARCCIAGVYTGCSGEGATSNRAQVCAVLSTLPADLQVQGPYHLLRNGGGLAGRAQSDKRLLEAQGFDVVYLPLDSLPAGGPSAAPWS